MHENNTNIIMQIVHGGPKWGPSPIKHKVSGTTPKEMTVDDIETVVASFAAAAGRAKKAGFDGVQIHAAHGFLLSMFLNPYYNVRNDEYGGSIMKRARIVLETYDAVRNVVGEDYPVLVKVNCEDFMENGLNLEDSFKVCKILSDNGIDLIEVSGGSYSSRAGEGPIRNTDVESYFLDQAEEIAEQVEVPVALVGGNRDLKSMNEILNTTQIEYFSMARPFIREPDIINRWIKENQESAECESCDPCNGVYNGCKHE